MGKEAFEKAKHYAASTVHIAHTDLEDDDALVFNLRAMAYAIGYEQARKDFITSELPKLLEMARHGKVRHTEQSLSDDAEFTYTIIDLIAMAKKGEE